MWLGVNAFAAYDLDRPNSQPASRVQILSGYHDTAVRVIRSRGHGVTSSWLSCNLGPVSVPSLFFEVHQTDAAVR